MKVGVYSNNSSVNTSIISMCASNGFKFQKILRYKSESFKGSDLVIIDLDNCADGVDSIKTDIPSMPEIVFVGISKNPDVLDNYRDIMNVERKPFNSSLFGQYQKLIMKRLESEIVVNKEEFRVYDEFGKNLAEAFSKSNIATEERLRVLKKTVKSKSNYKPEKEYLEDIGLSGLEVEGKQITQIKVLDIESEIQNDALVKYRIRKLKLMNLSNKMVDDKINEIINYNTVVSMGTGTPKMKEGERDILSKLRARGQQYDSEFQRKKREAEEEERRRQEEARRAEEESRPDFRPEKNIKSKTNDPNARVISGETPDNVVRDTGRNPLNQLKKEGSPMGAPLLRNGPLPKTMGAFKKPILNLSDDEEEPEGQIGPPMQGGFGLGRPTLGIDTHEEVPESSVEDSKPVAEDPLLKFRENKRRKLGIQDGGTGQIPLGTSLDKAHIKNNNGRRGIQDNMRANFGEQSLMDQMKGKIQYSNEHKKPKKESAFDIANKKSKPPR